MAALASGVAAVGASVAASGWGTAGVGAGSAATGFAVPADGAGAAAVGRDGQTVMKLCSRVEIRMQSMVAAGYASSIAAR